MLDLMEALWDVLIGNSLVRWFFIGLMIGLALVGWMIWNGSGMEAADGLMGIVANGLLAWSWSCACSRGFCGADRAGAPALEFPHRGAHGLRVMTHRIHPLRPLLRAGRIQAGPAAPDSAV